MLLRLLLRRPRLRRRARLDARADGATRTLMPHTGAARTSPGADRLPHVPSAPEPDDDERAVRDWLHQDQYGYGLPDTPAKEPY
ncbi:hypothetical protein ABZ313_42645 [Streptomyces sp. NPDC006251]|uniref:hypothetical protein n=1 Tax=Streptomyces sp. NPDC006251 TaxID=3155718 RepID=UPI0033A21C8B